MAKAKSSPDTVAAALEWTGDPEQPRVSGGDGPSHVYVRVRWRRRRRGCRGWWYLRPRVKGCEGRRSKGGDGVWGRCVSAKKGVARKSRGETVRSAVKGRYEGGEVKQVKEDDLPSRVSRKIVSGTERLINEEGGGMSPCRLWMGREG